ncbi:acyltransferase [Agrobacterium pusense]|uniref:acyltransferase n=1 Tax=Agrobacterium pusense TaxID=648995 RepID=UPI002FE22812
MDVFDSSYVREQKLRELGFLSVGENVHIDRSCTIIGKEYISIGSNVRIDGYSTIIASSVGIEIGSYVHIGSYCSLAGGAGISMGDFCGLSQGVRIFSKSDDYSGNHLTNPTVPGNFTNVKSGRVRLGRHVIIGSGTIILPGINVGEGAAVGALSLVTKNLDGWAIYTGAPAKRIKNRSQKLLTLEADLIKEQ